MTKDGRCSAWLYTAFNQNLHGTFLLELAYRIPWQSVNPFSGCEKSRSDSGDTASYPGRFESSVLKLLLRAYRNGNAQIGVFFCNSVVVKAAPNEGVHS